MNEVIGYRCKMCNQKMDTHGCSEHRQVTDHEDFEPILEDKNE